MRGLQAFLVEHVGLHGDRFAAVSADFSRDGLRGFEVQIEQRDLVAVRRERLGEGAAEHAARAGDDDIHEQFLPFI